MEVRVVADYPALGREGARIVAETIHRNPHASVLAATGDTPMGIYAELARMRARDELDTSSMRIVQLDEYLGVGPDDRRSLYGWMRREIAEPLGVGEDRMLRLPGDATDPVAACGAFDIAIADGGGIDLAILGLGPNGHLGFNEPPSGADAPTRVVELSSASIASNARYWGSPEDVPHRALTAGMTTILDARRVLLVVAGERKRQVTRRLLAEGPASRLPVSYLHAHRNALLLADRAAVPAGVA